MKNKPWLVIGSIALLAICGLAAIAIGLGVHSFMNRPHSTAFDNAGYYVRGDKVYYLGGFPSTPFEIAGADASNFAIIDSSYGHDATRVYFNGNPITDADPATFQLAQGSFTKDATHIFLGTEIFSDDAAHFEFVAPPLMRDSRHIYWDVNIVSDDPAGLVVLSNDANYTYFKDSRTVYVQGNPMTDADVATFEVFSAPYARDHAQVFYFDRAINGADSSSFEVIDPPYAKDSKHVYWMDKPINAADPNSFQVLNLNFECTRDKTHAYYEDGEISGFDLSTLPPNAHVTNCDANGLYFSQ